MKTGLSRLYDCDDITLAEDLSELLEDIAKADKLPRKTQDRIFSRVLRKAGIAMDKKQSSIRKKIAVTAAILAAAAVSVTAGAKIYNTAMTKEEHAEIIDAAYGESAASKLDEKGLIPDNEVICDHLKLTQELGASTGKDSQFIITIEAIDDIGLEKMRNMPNYDFELIAYDPNGGQYDSLNDVLDERGWGRFKRIADERYESFRFDVSTKTAEPLKLKVIAYEYIVPEEGNAERGEYLGEIEVELNKNIESYEFVSDDGVTARLTDMSYEIDDMVDITAETSDGTSDSFTQEDWDNWHNEVIFTVTMKDGSTQEYTRNQILGSGSASEGKTRQFFGEVILDAKDVESFTLMGKTYKKVK
ncbi:hypothetical protein [Ruminococcus sp. NK3A76]|uniref:hypothetical protein n=1 Tax=Ruminococcus sp. NK3A76 TaxID=877411 RepID=UPI00049198DB|nr:hypothetical protein [Ruminococcus sp. NK3A76]